jgi:cytoskeleton protein RodZ
MSDNATESGTNSGSRVAGGNSSAQSGSAVLASTSAGATLRAAREQRNWSREEVSVRLKFGVRQIAALEEERWNDLPHGMSLRGFVRNYARILDLPPEPLLQVLGPRFETGDPVSLTQASSLSSPLAPSSGRAWPGASRRRPAPWIIGCLMVLVAIALLGYALVQQGKLPSMTSAASKAKDVVATAVPSTGSAENIAQPNTVPEAAPAVPELPAPVIPSPEAPVAPAAAAAPPIAADGLVIRAREASWVEVRRANGSVAISQILAANGDFNLDAAAAPLRVVIGNAKGVDVSWRNAPVDLTSARRDNVARLTLN